MVRNSSQWNKKTSWNLENQNAWWQDGFFKLFYQCAYTSRCTQSVICTNEGLCACAYQQRKHLTFYAIGFHWHYLIAQWWGVHSPTCIHILMLIYHASNGEAVRHAIIQALRHITWAAKLAPLSWACIDLSWKQHNRGMFLPLWLKYGSIGQHWQHWTASVYPHNETCSVRASRMDVASGADECPESRKNTSHWSLAGQVAAGRVIENKSACTGRNVKTRIVRIGRKVFLPTNSHKTPVGFG